MNTLATRISRENIFPYLGVIFLGFLVYMLPLMSPSGKVLSLATTGLVFAISSASLGFLWGQCGQLTLAHAAIFGIGGYAAAICAKHFDLGFLYALPFSIGAGLVCGAMVALPSLRTRGPYFLILTFAIGEVISVIEMRLESITGGINGITTLPGTQQFLGLHLSQRADYYCIVVIFATIVFLILCGLMRSRWGVLLRGLRENSDLATSLGANVAKHRIIVFAVSGAIAGLAGQLYVYHVKFIAPELFTSHLSIIFLLVVLLGGKSYLLGPALGSLVYVFMPEFIGLSPILSQIVFGALLILMILTAPGGLLSLINRAIVWQKSEIPSKDIGIIK